MFELGSIDRELSETAPLFEKLRSAAPDFIEIRAAATSLHAFYNGIENIFAALARHIDGAVPAGERWHYSLLQMVSTANKQRSPLISSQLRQILEQFLAFRHFFRHSYGFILDWEQLKPLCSSRGEAFELFRKEIETILL